MPFDGVKSEEIRKTQAMNDDIFIFGTSGSDTIHGGAGHDLLVGLTGADHLSGGLGNDTLQGGPGEDTLFGGAGEDVLNGNQDDDFLDGGNGADLLAGDNGNDTLVGGADTDTLIGGSGADSLSGGAAIDQFEMDNIANLNGDRITDYESGEKISFSYYSYENTDPTTGLVRLPDLRLVTLGSDSRIEIDANRDGVFESAVTLEGVTGGTLVATDGGPSRLDLRVVFAAPAQATSDNDVLFGTSGSDTIDGRAGNDEVLGLAGADNLAGGAGSDTLRGGEGNDTLDGGTGSYDYDYLYGGDGNDTLRLNNAGQAYGDAGDDVLDARGIVASGGYAASVIMMGGTGNDKLYGGAGTDTLYGDEGNDTLSGGAGADTLHGGAGADSLTGGSGNDVFELGYLSNGSDLNGDRITDYESGEKISFSYYSYENTDPTTGLVRLPDLRLVTLGSDSRIEIDANRDGVFESAVTLEGVTGGTLVATDGGPSRLDLRVTDVVRGGGKILVGTEGNDTLTATTSDGWVLKGLEGNDSLTGGAGNDRLEGGAGNDRLEGKGGADTMIGGLGNDDYIVDSVQDVVIEAAGEGTRDRIMTSVDYKLPENVEHIQIVNKGNIAITGNSLNNYMGGHAGNNVLDGGSGADTMDGGAGNDVYYVDDLRDKVIEQAGGGNDLVFSSVSYTLGDHVEDLQLSGFNDIGGSGNALGNRIIGNSGANVLDGGAGRDVLMGGMGNDTFRFSAGEADGDWVLDFQRPMPGWSNFGDKLVFVGYGRDARFSQVGQSDIYVVSDADGMVRDEIRILGNYGLTSQDATFVDL